MSNTVLTKLDNLGGLPTYASTLASAGGLYGLPPPTAYSDGGMLFERGAMRMFRAALRSASNWNGTAFPFLLYPHLELVYLNILPCRAFLRSAFVSPICPQYEQRLEVCFAFTHSTKIPLRGASSAMRAWICPNW